MVKKIDIKTPPEIEVMKEGGQILADIKRSLYAAVKVGVRASEIDQLADKLIEKSHAKPSFKMVKDYKWATCINVNDGVVHGIPHETVVFKEGGVVSVDVGIFYKGFHTDTSFSVALDGSLEVKKFLRAGIEALDEAIASATNGNYIFDISRSIETTLANYGYSPIRALVGHGIGRNLHEYPQVPCFTSVSRESTPIIPVRSTLAIEVMYTQGSPDVVVDPKDKWTISTKDGKIAALFEETVAITLDGPLVLTN